MLKSNGNFKSEICNCIKSFKKGKKRLDFNPMLFKKGKKRLDFNPITTFLFEMRYMKAITFSVRNYSARLLSEFQYGLGFQFGAQQYYDKLVQ